VFSESDSKGHDHQGWVGVAGRDEGRTARDEDVLGAVDPEVGVDHAIFWRGRHAGAAHLVETADETGERWTTVGVSGNIIDASFQALIDSISYKLVRSGAVV